MINFVKVVTGHVELEFGIDVFGILIAIIVMHAVNCNFWSW